MLSARWSALLSVEPEERRALFHETSGWKITKKVSDDLPGWGQPSIYDATVSTPMPIPSAYMFRTFDRHKALFDLRLGDRLRPQLFTVLGEKQVFFSTLLTDPLANGQALSVAAHIPDLHHFRGSFGGKGNFPLYRDAEATQPNITAGLLQKLSDFYGETISPEDFAAYVYALLGGQSYTIRF